MMSGRRLGRKREREREHAEALGRNSTGDVLVPDQWKKTYTGET